MWKILKSCAIGEQHIAAHRPCQDRYLVCQTDDRLILAVADGHGGSFYCRSNVGARYACEAAVEILKDTTVPWEFVPQHIKALYDSKVEAHLLKKPLTEDERILVNGQPDRVAYGSTLLTTCITPEGIFRAQVGDGEMHVVTTYGNLLDDLPEDDNCVGFFTTSLVSPFAANQFRWSFDRETPAVAVLYTDGYVSHKSCPWEVLDLAKTLPDKIPQEVLDAGKRGDDQTVLVAIHSESVKTPAFLEGYAKVEAQCLLLERQANILEKIYTADKTIKSYISKLAKCENIRIRNRLIEALCNRQQKFLELCDEYQTLEEQKANTEEYTESPNENRTITDVTEDCDPNPESMG